MICIYHSRDLDGWMSAAIVKLKHPDVKLIGWDYGQPKPNTSFEKVIMVDISFPLEQMKFQNEQNEFIWIDHHKSAIEAVNIYPHEISGLRDSSFAACELTWKYFFPEQEMPEIVRLLGRYDCFGHKGTEEELKVLEFQYGARASLFDPETCYEALKNWDTNLEHTIQVAGYNIYNYLCTEAEQIYARKFDILWGNKIIAMVNQERFNPINFGIDYHKEGYDAFGCFHYVKGKWMFSLYNDNGNVDVSELCKQQGGGGHKGAAGFIKEDISWLFQYVVNPKL